MIEKALKYLVGLGEANVRDIELPDGTIQTYSDKPLTRLQKHIPMCIKAISMTTLSSLVDYIKSKVDDLSMMMIVHVVSPDHVVLYSPLNEEREREYIAEVNADVPAFSFNQFIPHDKFIINVQTKFIDDVVTDKALLLKFAGTVEGGSVAEYGDDGITQKATIKTGIASKTDAVVPNPVILRAFRTFPEVEQPISQFVFRMQENKYEGVECAIYEADGGAWKNQATQAIQAYLKKELEGYADFIVIA